VSARATSLTAGTDLLATPVDAIGSVWLDAQRWLLRAGAVVLPLILVWDAYDRYVLPKLLAARLLAIAMLALLLVRSVMTGRWTWRRTALDIPVLFFLASSALSSVFAVNQNVALFGMYLRYEGLLTILTYAVIFWLTVQLIPNQQAARDLGRAMLVGACIVTVIAVYLASTRFGAGPETTVGAYVRAFGTMANPVELGTYLAMLLPLALAEVLTVSSIEQRLLSASALIILTAGLVLTFTRAAWAAALVGVVIVALVNPPNRQLVIGGSVAIVALVAVLALAVATGRIGGASSLTHALGSRVVSPTSLSQGSIPARLAVWSDSLKLLGRHPFLGSGPDTFGLVYPSVESSGEPGIDKAHNDVLQVAVTNGLLGVLAYYLIVAAIVVQLWRHRRVRWVAALFAGLVAYYIALQAEFSWVPSALPFWLFAGATFAAAFGTSRGASHRLIWPHWRRTALAASIAAAGLVVAYFAVVPDLYADRIFARAITDAGVGAKDTARLEVAWARTLNPHQSIYAVEAGHLALDMRFGFRPGPNADVVAARNAYQDAVQLGTTDPSAYRGLAVADAALGDRADAIAAARRAVQLNSLDPGNAAVLQIVQGST